MEFKLVYQNSFHCVLLLHVSNHKVTPTYSAYTKHQNYFYQKYYNQKIVCKHKGTVNVVLNYPVVELHAEFLIEHLIPS